MAHDRVKGDWRLDVAFPLLARVPTTLPWHLAEWVGRESSGARRDVQLLLESRFAQAFPGSTGAERSHWARAHLRMLAQEMVDALAFQRVGAFGGPDIEITGLEHADALFRRGQGFILVLNHFDRLLTAPVALARHGISLNVLTMPVLDNPELGPSLRRFLLRKIQTFTGATRGQWRTTSQGLRPVHESLRAGQAWVILADAWRPEFSRLRSHPFLGGELHLPTGIERLAQSTGVPLLYATTYTEGPARLRVTVDRLADQPEQAIDQVIQRLARDVEKRPWAWWHWGLWEQMWSPVKRGAL